MLVILKFNITDMQKSVTTNPKIDERRLDTGFDINDPPLVDVADIIFETVSLDLKLLQYSIFNDGNSTFLRLEDIHQHFFFHYSPLTKNECAERFAIMSGPPLPISNAKIQARFRHREPGFANGHSRKRMT